MWMKQPMFLLSDKKKVLHAIVPLVAINMMYFFFIGKGPSDILLHNEYMFKHNPVTYSYSIVPRSFRSSFLKIVHTTEIMPMRRSIASAFRAIMFSAPDHEGIAVSAISPIMELAITMSLNKLTASWDCADSLHSNYCITMIRYMLDNSFGEVRHF